MNSNYNINSEKYLSANGIKNQGGYYSLVIAVSKRAREIVENHENSTKEYTIKPVKMAENEIASGKLVIIEPKEIVEGF